MVPETRGYTGDSIGSRDCFFYTLDDQKYEKSEVVKSQSTESGFCFRKLQKVSIPKKKVMDDLLPKPLLLQRLFGRL